LANMETARADKRIFIIRASGLDKFGLIIVQYCPMKLLEYVIIIVITFAFIYTVYCKVNCVQFKEFLIWK